MTRTSSHIHLQQLTGGSPFERVKAAGPCEMRYTVECLGRCQPTHSHCQRSLERAIYETAYCRQAILKSQDQVTYEPERNVLRIDTAHLQEQLAKHRPYTWYINACRTYRAHFTCVRAEPRCNAGNLEAARHRWQNIRIHDHVPPIRRRADS